MTRRVVSLLLTLTLISMFPAMTGKAQTATATIVGTVLDPQGAVVANADVTARNVDTGIERTTKSTSEGLYRFGNLPPGVYDVRVETQGFGKAEAKGVKLQVGEQRDVNFALVVSGSTATVDITAGEALVETSKTDVSSVIDSKQVATLPTTTSFNGIGGVANDYAGLATIAPGVKYDFTTVSSDLTGPGAVNNRGIQVNVDGGTISDQVVSGRDSLGASVEEVKEFQVLTNSYNAEYGQSGGVVLNVITKSGTNGFHGDGHYYTRGRNLTASTFFYNTSDAANFRRAPFHKYEGGFTAGGPLIKDRTFWFTSYEQTRQGIPIQLTPPGGSINLTQPTKELLWSAKIDHKLSANNSISARFNLQRDLTDNIVVQIPNFAAPESLVSTVVHDHTLNISLTSTPTTHIVNEARFFWHRLLSQTPTKSESPGQQGANFYTGAAFCCPQGADQNRYQYIDNLSWTHGTHTVKTGLNISHFPYFSLFTQFHFGLYKGFPNPAPNQGLPTQFQVGIGPAQVNATDNIYGFYVQDTWKLKSNLTLNYGVRYDLEDGAFKGGTIKADVKGGCLQGNGIVPACSSDHNNWQPRVGLAWSPRFEKGFLHTIFGDTDKSVIRASFAEVTQLAYLNVSLDSLNFDGVNLFTTTFTSPAVLSFFPNRPPDSLLSTLRPPGFFGRVRPIANDLRNPEVRHFNASITRQIGRTFVLDVGYVGVLGYGLFGERDTNFPIIKADPSHPGFFYFGGRPDVRLDAVRTNENSRTSAYHGLLVSATKRLSHHFQFQAGYALSKQLSSSEDFFGLSEPGDVTNIHAERALAQNDTRHQGNFGLVFDTEKLTDRSIVRHVVNDWTIGVIGQLQSGRPYPVSTGDVPFATSAFFGAGNESQQRPNVLPDGTLISTNIASAFQTNLNISQAGKVVCPTCPQTTFLAPADADPRGSVDTLTGDLVDFQFVNGNLVRNAGHTDPYYRFDMSFIKAFPIRESMRLELKADIFNIFNHPLFLLFNTNDVLSLMAVSTDPNCRGCLNAHTGRYIGADGRVLKIQDLQSGRVSRDIQNGIFATLNPGGNRGQGIGDPAATDITRTVQLSVRFRW
ncbi:MAG TPA: carboxypeptidase regulatory-like domain-containing protein [Blastocatellia bacterium]|nr:carboxypeptidase regulatory-like domain-containing protein [Blastocatellia bacterium]